MYYNQESIIQQKKEYSQDNKMPSGRNIDLESETEKKMETPLSLQDSPCDIAELTQNKQTTGKNILPKNKTKISKISSYFNNDFVKFHLSFCTFAVLGNYTRLGIDQLSASYNPSYVTSGTILWTNFTACFIMGFLQTINCGSPFQSVLTSGYCGTFSSFSTFIWELFQHSTSTSQYPNNAYGIMEFLSVLVLELTVSMGATLFGIEFGKTYLSQTTITQSSTTTTNNNRANKLESMLVKYLYPASYYLAIPIVCVMVVLASVYSNFSRFWTLSSIFAIFGSVTRFYLSKLNSKPISRNFPLGTFAANILACLILSALKIVTLSQNPNILKNDGNSKRILVALSDGLCAGLSTMSTFMVEGKKLPLTKTLIYYTTTIGLSYIIFIVMVGSYKWTVGIY